MDKKELYIWMDGSLVPWNDANVHVMSYTIHYGSGIFEGIRSYGVLNGTSIFRLSDHIDRFFNSAKILDLEIGHDKQDIRNAIIQTVKKNGLSNSYIRPVSLLGANLLTLRSVPRTHTAIANWDLGSYVKPDGDIKGISTKISSYTRFAPNSVFTKAKISGNYVNTTLAIREAIRDGYDEAILLGVEGYVAEGSCENIFIVNNRVLYTPFDKNILPGITRDSIMKIATSLNLEVIEKDISRDELYLCDEVFLAATAAEIVPVISIDGRKIDKGEVGEITTLLSTQYDKVVLGKIKEFSDWCTFVKYG